MREEKNDPGEKKHFYKIEASTADLVELATISLDDLGALAFMGCQVNPHTGFCITNHSMFGRMANISTDRARHLFKKLEGAGLIRFLSCQRGRYSKGLLFVMGRSLASGGVVNDEFVSRTAEKRGANYELESDYTNKKNERFPNTATSEGIEKSRIDREGEETETERDRANENATACPIFEAPITHPLFKNITTVNWTFICAKYEISWLKGRLQSYADRLTKGPLTFDRLTGMLAEDWTRHKPTKDYRIENDELEAKRRIWEADQKADEGKPPPEALLEWRKKRDRMRGPGATAREAAKELNELNAIKKGFKY